MKKQPKQRATPPPNILREWAAARGYTYADLAERCGCNLAGIYHAARRGIPPGVLGVSGVKPTVSIEALALAVGEPVAWVAADLAPLVEAWRANHPGSADVPVVAGAAAHLQAERIARAAVWAARAERLRAVVGEQTRAELAERLGVSPATARKMLTESGYRLPGEPGRGLFASEVEAALGLAQGTLEGAT